MLAESHPLAEAQAMLMFWFEKAPPDSWIEFSALLAKDDPRIKDKSAPRAMIEACRVKTLEASFDSVIADWIVRSNRNRYQTYFSVCPRDFMRTSAANRPKAADNDCVTKAVGAWVDLDSPRWKAHVDSAKPPATFITSTGHGAQFFFRYGNAVPIAQAVEDSKRLAATHGGDNVFDPRRVMRIPGTKNWKPDFPTPPTAEIYSADFDKIFAGADNGKSGSSVKEGDINSLQWWLRDAILNGHEGAQPPLVKEGEGGANVDRSEVDFAVMKELFSAGWGEESIEAVFRNVDYGISAKVIEEDARGNSENYLGVSLRKALNHANVEKSRWGEVGEVLVLEDTESLKKAPKLQFAVDRILPVGGILVVSGSSKAGKSLAVTDLMLLLAGGEGMFLERFRVNAPGPVVYCQAEVSRASLKYRLNTIAASREMLWEPLPLKFYCGPFDLQSQRHVSALTKALIAAKAKYMILDPLARYHKGNENSTEIMGAVLSNFERAAKDAGLAGAILVHHHGKPSADAPKQGVHRMRGASVIGDWGDGHLLMGKSFSDSTKRKYVRFELELRSAEELDPFSMMLDAERLRFGDFSESEEKIAIAMGLAEAFGNGTTTAKETRDEIADRLETTKTEADRLFAKARARMETDKSHPKDPAPAEAPSEPVEPPSEPPEPGSEG